MNGMQKRADVRGNAEILIRYLEGHQPAPVESLVQDGVMNRAAATEALQYALRHGAIERVQSSAGCFEAISRYSLTGHALRREGKELRVVFDALLGAWGMALEPPPVVGDLSARVVLRG
jgi:hypothetical protein